MYQASRDYTPAPISCCKVQKGDVQSDHQNLHVNYDTAVYTSKERMHKKNGVAYCINNYVISFNTDSWQTKNIASCCSNNSANCINYWSCRQKADYAKMAASKMAASSLK